MVTIEELEKYCEGKDFHLSDFAENVIRMVNKRNGNCPCRVDDFACPCEYHLEEIESQGHCHCNLFVKD